MPATICLVRCSIMIKWRVKLTFCLKVHLISKLTKALHWSNMTVLFPMSCSIHLVASLSECANERRRKACLFAACLCPNPLLTVPLQLVDCWNFYLSVWALFKHGYIGERPLFNPLSHPFLANMLEEDKCTLWYVVRSFIFQSRFTENSSSVLTR